MFETTEKGVTGSRQRRLLVLRSFIVALVLFSVVAAAVAANAGTGALVGYRDFSYGADCSSNPTAEKPESKLWWNDGYWWGSLCDPVESEYHIYRLDLESQTWQDTGVLLDPRSSSRADVLWDGNKLYVASHKVAEPGENVPNEADWGRLYRYSYSAATDTYTPDNLGAVPGQFYAYVNEAETETLTLAKDSTGQLWVTFVVSDTVYVNRSQSSDGDWGTPFPLPVTGASGVTTDDIATIVSYEDDGGGERIGVMWTNQNTDTVYFASHPDTSGDTADWEVVGALSFSGVAEDHVNIKSLQSDSAGNIFAVIKTGISNPSIVLLACADGTDCTEAGNWAWYPVFARDNPFEPTRPILLIDESNRELYVFVTSQEGGGSIYYKSSPIDTINFSSPTNPGTLFLQSDTDPQINNATSTKQNLTSETGLVVLAADASTRYYLHNYLCLDDTGAFCPTERTVQFGQVAYSADEGDGTAAITVTLNAPSAGTITVNYATSDGTATSPDDYTSTSGTLTFDPFETSQTFTIPIVDDPAEEADETVNISLSAPSGASLGTPNTAVLTIVNDDGPPTVQFSADDFTADETGGTATVEVSLSHAAAGTVTVNYATADGTATAGSDYESTSGTLTFAPGQTSRSFTVPILFDGDEEGDETFNVTLSSPDNSVLGTPSTATVTIVDNVTSQRLLYMPIIRRN